MQSFRTDFPIFAQHPKLVYLDSAATAQKPAEVIEAVSSLYRESYGPVHRGLYPLSQQSTSAYEAARKKVAAFIGASDSSEVIFTAGATDSLNFLASSLGSMLKAGERVILSEMEHHANLLPWQILAKQRDLELVFVKISAAGEIELPHLEQLLTEDTRIISLSHCSNVLGRRTNLAGIHALLARRGSSAVLIADASQSAPHFPISVSNLGVDFLVFSGHKLYAPAGIGILWGESKRLASLPPYRFGGEMVTSATYEDFSLNAPPWRWEAGTPNLEGAVGLATAIDYLNAIGWKEIQQGTAALSTKLQDRLKEIPEINLIGQPEPESGIISFITKGIHPHDLAGMLAEKEICIRAGHHCAAPLHHRLGLTASNRISLGVYNDQNDLRSFIAGLKEIVYDFSHV